jgi:hypothetical protein
MPSLSLKVEQYISSLVFLWSIPTASQLEMMQVRIAEGGPPGEALLMQFFE